MSVPDNSYRISTSGSTIQITSGHIKGSADIVRKKNVATYNAVFNSAVLAFKDIEGGLALKSGDLRKFMRLSVANLVNDQRGNSKIIVNFDLAVQIASRLREYIKYHYVQGAEFNPNYNPAGYTNPTTKGTKPINFDDFSRAFYSHLPTQYRNALRTQGFDVT